MRATTIVALALVATAGQTLAAASPYRAGSLARPHSKVPIPKPPRLARDLAAEELLARSFGSDFIDGFKKGFVDTLETVGPLAIGFLKRELTARASDPNIARDMASALESISTKILDVVKREGGDELLARTILSQLPEFSHGFFVPKPVGESFKREDELLARESSGFVKANTGMKGRSFNELD